MKYDIVIIGGGPAGLAAAVAAYDAGGRSILILERDDRLGGILNQCIHNGFGLHTFGEELTGPEYAQRFAKQVLDRGIDYKLNTMVLSIGEDKKITAMNRTDGLIDIEARAVILAMGCRERSPEYPGVPPCRYLFRRNGATSGEYGGVSPRPESGHPGQRRYWPHYGPPHDPGGCQGPGGGGADALFRRLEAEYCPVPQ